MASSMPVRKHGTSSSSRVQEISKITNEQAKKKFSFLAKMYELQMEQGIKSRDMIRFLVGDQENPGDMWQLIEYYGTKITDGSDVQEHALRHNDTVWSIRRTNKKTQWNEPTALKLFQYAYVIQTSEDGSQKQSDAFQGFKSCLESNVSEDISLSDDEWWSLIDDAADLFRTAVVRKIHVDALDAVRSSLPRLLVDALTVPIAPVYSLQSCKDRSREHDTSSIHHKITCSSCTGGVDDDDFYCRHCGVILGVE